MSDPVLIALIVIIGGAITAIAWKLLDIGRRAMELDRGGDTD